MSAARSLVARDGNGSNACITSSVPAFNQVSAEPPKLKYRERRVKGRKTEAEMRQPRGTAHPDDYLEANVDAICRRHVASEAAGGLWRANVSARYSCA